MAYADARFWDQYFRELRRSGGDLDGEGPWTAPFLTPLRLAGTRTILELGHGTRNHAARLARERYQATAIDLSAEAIERARSRFGYRVRFLIADMAPQLPFPEASFDAVMSNVALHTFPDTVTRSVFAEVRSLVPPACPCSTSTRSRATRYAAADGQRHVSSNQTSSWRRPARPCTSSPSPTCASSSRMERTASQLDRDYPSRNR